VRRPFFAVQQHSFRKLRRGSAGAGWFLAIAAGAALPFGVGVIGHGKAKPIISLRCGERISGHEGSSGGRNERLLATHIFAERRRSPEPFWKAKKDGNLWSA
jgi:hypothetical protein